MNSEQTYQLALWSVSGIGRITYRKILSALEHSHISLAEWWSHPARYQKLIPLRKNQFEAWEIFSKKYTPSNFAEYLTERHIKVVHESAPEYPTNLLVLDDRPPFLFVQGRALFEEKAIAVVGTRKITSYGQMVTRKIVTELVAVEVTIVSGFMCGVDAAAHQAAHTASGRTIAVLGFGFDYLFPANFRALKDRLLQAGQTFVTEYPPDTQPTKGTFPARNRLIAGLSQGLVVTEAAGKSGSHITAEWAVEYGRSVYAVPGPITSLYSEGTRALLNMGALCIQSGQEVLEDLGWPTYNPAATKSPNQPDLPPLATTIYSHLATQTSTLTDLTQQFQQSSQVILMTLTHLEIAGLIRKNGSLWSVQK